MLTTTRTVTINPAFLQEIKDDDVQLKALLEQTLKVGESVLLTDMPIRRVASLLAELRDHLGMHFALEEACGYFDDPLSVAPHLSERAESLRKQHGQLYEEIAQIAETAQDISRRNRDPRGIRNLTHCFMNFYGRLQDHDSRVIWSVVFRRSCPWRRAHLIPICTS